MGSIPESERSPGIGNGTHSSILAWRIPWTEEPGRLQSMQSQRDTGLSTRASALAEHWRNYWAHRGSSANGVRTETAQLVSVGHDLTWRVPREETGSRLSCTGVQIHRSPDPPSWGSWWREMISTSEGLSVQEGKPLCGKDKRMAWGLLW